MSRAHLLALAIVVVIGVVTAVGLLGRVEPARDEPAAIPSTPSPTRTTATPAPLPEQGACYLLDYGAAVAPTSRARAVDCSREHTTETFLVGRLDLVTDGHLLAVDSGPARRQAASTCRDAAGRHLGASTEALRLTLLETIWFTPTADQARQGADWLRCDVVAASGGEQLVPLPVATRGLLANGGGDDYSMCGTAEPGAEGFSRVVCSARHSWRAVASVDLPGSSYPTGDEAGRVMEPRCRDAAEAAAGDALDLRWAEERPTRDQWEAGRRYGLCWVPEQDG